MIKNGTQHIASLRDGRQVYLNGQPVGDVTAHAAFRNSIRSYASLYDYQARDENVEKMTFVSPDSGNRVSRIWQLRPPTTNSSNAVPRWKRGRSCITASWAARRITSRPVLPAW
ncbi:4-nitrophenol 2-monooxygenase, oxygenase component [Burkholderia cepacia]|nr:4-nitrophenol 2-monooxygenase, oxygenase component [Burkholderia cepacia]